MRISDWSSDVCSSDLGDLRYGLPAVSQCRRDRVDGKLDALTYTRVIFSAAMALQQFDLKKIQRLYIRQTKTDRTIERRIPFQKTGLTGNGEQPIMGLLPSFPDASDDRLRGFLILHQIRKARSQGHVRFRPPPFHIANHSLKK